MAWDAPGHAKAHEGRGAMLPPAMWNAKRDFATFSAGQRTAP